MGQKVRPLNLHRNFMDITVKEISAAQFDAEEQKIRASHKSLADLQESWKSLDQFFRNGSPSQDRKYWWTYFRVYVDLTRKLYSSLEPDVMTKVVFGRQVPMAILMDVDMVKELLLYFSLHAAVEQDMHNLYIQIKEAFIESQAILGVWKDKEITVAEIVKEFFFIKQRGSDALGLAEFNTKLKEILFPKNDFLVDKYVLIDPDTAIYRLTQLAIFFYLMEPKDIWYAVDAFVNQKGVGAPEEVEGGPATAAVVEAGLAAAGAAAEPPKPPEPIKKEEAKEKTAVSPKKELPKPSAAEIKKMIETQFKKGADGQFEDIESVFAKLNELAKKYNDPKINELVYYDEKTGKFKWTV